MTWNIRSTSCGVDTPSATTSRDSRFTAAHTRLKMKPVLSLRASNGNSPNFGSVAITKSMTSRSVWPQDMTSTAVLLRRHVEVDVQHPFGVVDLVQEQPAGVGRRIAGQDGVGGGQFVELSEDLLLQLEPLGDRLDDQPRVVYRLGEVGLNRNPARHNISEAVRQRGKIVRHVVERGVALCFGEVVDHHLRTVCGEHQRDAPSERTGADDGHRPAREVALGR